MSDAKERLASRRAQEHAQNLQSQMEAKGAAIEELGHKLGAPIDFSQGIPMGPPPAAKTGSVKAPVRPDIVIPKPPSQTRDEDEQQSKEEADAERLTYEAAMRAAGVPQVPANPEDFQSKKPLPKRDTTKVAHKRPVHPLLAQLRNEFGIESEQKPPVDVMVADHIWTFVPLSPEMISLTARLADNLSQTASEHGVRSEHSAVCCSIIACDHVPVWMMLGMEPSDKDDISFPLIPKGPIRAQAAFRLYGVLTEQMNNRLIDVLYEAYVDKVDRTGQVKSYTVYENAVEQVVWVCPISACDHQVNRPRRYDDNNVELPYYCERHGSEMLEISTTKPRIDEDLRPLV